MKDARNSTFRLTVFMLVAVVATAQQRKPRVVITADPELDDNNTLIRAILYSSDFQIEGLVYASSSFHWKGDGKGTTQYIPGREYTRLGLCPCTSWRWASDEHFIDSIVEAYARIYANLKVHNPNYPSPAELKSKIKWGNVAFEGDYSKDTEASNLIKSLLLDDQPGTLYVTAQGGQSTIHRAQRTAPRNVLPRPGSPDDLVQMMAERGVGLTHTTILRWVQRYVPEFEKRWNQYALPVGGSWRCDETYIKVKGRWTYLYRAVDAMWLRPNASSARHWRTMLHHGSLRSMLTPLRIERSRN